MLNVSFGLATIARDASLEQKANYRKFVAETKELHIACLSFDDWKEFGCLTLDGLRERFGIGQEVSKVIRLDDGLPLVSKSGRQSVREPRGERVARTSTAGSRRIPAMFAEGIINAGDKVGILRHADAKAIVVDAKNVKVGDEVMTFNEFAQKTLGHKAVNVYIWTTINGKLLNDLR